MSHLSQCASQFAEVASETDVHYCVGSHSAKHIVCYSKLDFR